jgi:methionine-S-sulfoxide reductase
MTFPKVMVTTLFMAVSTAFAAQTVAAEPAPAGNTTASDGKHAIAIFASGCFWCSESDFEKVNGVIEVVSGYTGGHTPNPTYEQVGRGDTGHAEAVRVVYDPTKVSYGRLLDYYWRHTDVLDGGGQFCDRGDQYRPAIFISSPDEQREAETSKEALQKSGRFDKPIAVQIVPAGPFTDAEDYHQNYYKKHPVKYAFYRSGCGRDSRLANVWGDEAKH